MFDFKKICTTVENLTEEERVAKLDDETEIHF